MTEYSKYNIVYRLQKWIDSVPGQTFLNYAYSWGAAIVILGTLFKLTHLPGANIMLFIGMGTEVCVFFISAFDRPFDKTADGLELPTHPDLDEEVPAEQNASKPVKYNSFTLQMQALRLKMQLLWLLKVLLLQCQSKPSLGQNNSKHKLQSY